MECYIYIYISTPATEVHSSVHSRSDFMFPSTQYQALAGMKSTDFPTPLKDAECVSLVMAYEFCKTFHSKNKSAIFLNWIACQLDSEDSERKPACLFAVSSN